MATLIQKARKGNSDAMMTLYNDNKERVLFLCTLLLEDTNTAFNSIPRIFRNMWELIIAEQIENEYEFSRAVIEKTVNYCKSCISKKDSKAFRTPINKNFSGTNYSEDALIEDENLSLFIVRNLPHLHRFIYILHALFDYKEDDITQVFKMNKATVKLALDSEDANIKRLISIGKQHTSEICTLSVSEFHRELEKIGDSLSIPNSVDTAVISGIDAICLPLIEKEKKQRNITIMYICIGVLGLCLIGCIVFAILKSADNNDDTDTSEDTASDTDTDADDISMARGAYDYDSASSQFFIVHTEDYIDSLDGQYAVFGYVIEGMDIVDTICSATYTMDENETIAKDEQPIITSITIREVSDSEIS